ncbi:MAG: LysM peptidoglycan-binding domain-containing protein [Nitrospinae bacterium]|nr:LysM peptidoglycan-binding domain-containing protein [Nitrospinota bacterium]
MKKNIKNSPILKTFIFFIAILFVNGCTAVKSTKQSSLKSSFVGFESSSQRNLEKALEAYNNAWEQWESNDVEAAFNSLDEAYTFVLEVDEKRNPELLQEKDDLRILISKRVVEIYSTQRSSIKGNHKAIPIVINEAVNNEIKRFQGVERNFFTQSHQRSGEYRDMMVKKLKKAGLPEELSWLPLIESGFKVQAYSRAKALGLWQFIPSTGFKFGLKRDGWKDERMDPEKSTDAAVAYLTELHNLFGDWMTVLAAYNSGEGRVLRLIRSQKVKYLDDFWDLQHRLPRETSRYVPRFLATLAIMKNPAQYGFKFGELNSPLRFETVTVQKSMHFNEIAKKTGFSKDTLVKLNAELRMQATPPTPYELKVPRGMKEVLMVKVNEIPSWKAPQREFVQHRVRSGETLSYIAKRYRTSVKAILSFNKIKRSKTIYIGQRLKIPSRNAYHTKRARAYKAGKGVKHRVKNGDTLWALAMKYGVSTKKLKSYNQLKGNMLHQGQVIVIPKS